MTGDVPEGFRYPVLGLGSGHTETGTELVQRISDETGIPFADVARLLEEDGSVYDDIVAQRSPEPCPLKPTDLPDQRLHLMDLWKPGGMYERLVDFAGSIGTESFSDYDKLREGELYWVSPDTCSTVWAAWDSYPEDTTLDPTFLPAECGFVVFAEPFMGHDAQTGELIRVDAICWGPVRLKSRVSDAWGEGISMTAYRWMSDLDGLVVLGRSDWLFGRRLDAHSFDDDPIPDVNLASVVEDRKVFSTLCSLVTNPRLVTNEPARQPRQARRRQEREAQKVGVDPDRVRVHTLHVKGEGEAPPEEEGGSGRTYRHRWVVRPHWRQQAYGPNRSLRRPVLILPYVKGPEGAPLLDPKNRVTKL